MKSCVGKLVDTLGEPSLDQDILITEDFVGQGLRKTSPKLLHFNLGFGVVFGKKGRDGKRPVGSDLVTKIPLG
ncbi:hypothetical protein LIER_31740 [Lithospermum erythrorhizon]|uniref:Uncharacterized protein n=1 Tax=Lithospermum erythrorhizon TaxID=34254 RepID=A0AAV3RVM9_LITER